MIFVSIVQLVKGEVVKTPSSIVSYVTCYVISTYKADLFKVQVTGECTSEYS